MQRIWTVSLMIAGVTVAAAFAELAHKTALVAAPMAAPQAQERELLARDGQKLDSELAPSIAKRLAAWPETARGNVMRSTLDRQIQWVALRALQMEIGAGRDQNLTEGAAIVIENSTGNVLAYVGSVPAGADVDAVMAPRQAGALLKPLLYGKAIHEKIRTAATLRAALVSGMDLPAVQALQWIGIDAFVQTLTDFGMTQLHHPEAIGPTLALGMVDVRLSEITNAYRALANGGVWSPLRFSPAKLSEQAAKRVLSPAAAFIVRDMMSGGKALAIQASRSQDQRDNWCVGFSDRYTVGVWAGTPSNAALWAVSAAQGAAPVWSEIMNELQHQKPAEKIEPPEGLVQENAEWFVVGTEPSQMALNARPGVRSHITFPHDRSSIAAVDLERALLIQVSAPKADQNLYLNDRRIGPAKSYQTWEPRAGKFVLELRNSMGRVVDRVRFQVGRRQDEIASAALSR